MGRQLHTIECYIRDTITGVEDPPFQRDSVPEFHLMGLARRAEDCHLAIEVGFKTLINRAGAKFDCKHGLLSHLKQLERVESALGHDKQSVPFIRRCFDAAVAFYGKNRNAHSYLRTVEDYLAATGGNDAYQQYRYWMSYMALTWAWVCSLAESTTRCEPDADSSAAVNSSTAADWRPPCWVYSR